VALRQIPYNRNIAAEYAIKWAMSRNPAYYNFDALGGDCTNFVSQCVYAACLVMNYSPVSGWYYINANDRSPSWTGVEQFHSFLTSNTGTGPFGYDTHKNDIQIGDVVQLGKSDGSFYHTLLVLNIIESEVYIAAHSSDSRMRPLTSYSYERIRYTHIVGARKYQRL